jgi:phage-related protein
MNRVSNIRTGDPKIVKAPNMLTIASGISKWCTVSGSEVNTKLYRSVNSAVISECSMRKEVLSVLLLREKNTIRCEGDLKTKEVTKMT